MAHDSHSVHVWRTIAHLLLPWIQRARVSVIDLTAILSLGLLIVDRGGSQVRGGVHAEPDQARPCAGLAVGFAAGLDFSISQDGLASTREPVMAAGAQPQSSLSPAQRAH